MMSCIGHTSTLAGVTVATSRSLPQYNCYCIPCLRAGCTASSIDEDFEPSLKRRHMSCPLAPMTTQMMSSLLHATCCCLPDIPTACHLQLFQVEDGTPSPSSSAPPPAAPAQQRQQQQQQQPDFAAEPGGFGSGGTQNTLDEPLWVKSAASALRSALAFVATYHKLLRGVWDVTSLFRLGPGVDVQPFCRAPMFSAQPASCQYIHAAALRKCGA